MSRECCGDDATPLTVGSRRPRPAISPRAAEETCGGGEGHEGCQPGGLPQGSTTDRALLPLTGAGPSKAPDGGTLIVDDACCGPREVPTGDAAAATTVPWWRDRHVLLPLTSGAALGAGFLTGSLGFDRAALVLEWLALLLGASTYVPGALRRLGKRRLGVGLLMTIAAVGAVALGRIGEAAALAFLFSIAEALEDRALDRARRGLRALLSLVPDTARVEVPGTTDLLTVSAQDLRPGQVMQLGAGERAATDGVVLTGRSSLDTSAITGESIPVEVGPGDQVPAGSVNATGTLRVQASSPGNDSSLTTIVRLVEQAQARKGERARLADRIARPMVPAVLALSLAVALGGLFTDEPGLWLERALVVLVAASPCAMAIAVPVTVIAAIGSASRLGVVIRSGEAFEQLGAVRTVAFDKTGTLTRNAPRVVEVHVVEPDPASPLEATGASVDTLDDTSEATRKARVLMIAAALERTSTHPLAAAVAAAALEASATTGIDRDLPVTDVNEDPGHGLTGIVDGQPVRVGGPRWLDPGPLQPNADAMALAGMSLVVVQVEAKTVAVIGVRDELRPDAAPALRELHDAGVRTVMLTGDNPQTAHALARQVGITDVRAGLLPRDKAEAVTELGAQQPTAMVGDGVNDAPALAAATVGIAMGATGSAAAVEAADVAFTGHDLRLLTRALRHARRGRTIMTQNIGLALAIIIVLLPLALLGVLGLAQVVLVHELAEVVVIANGLRAARVRTDPLPLIPDTSTVAVLSEPRAPGARVDAG